MSTVACYIRVPVGMKNRTAQEEAIKAWLKKNRIHARKVRWYREKSSRGKLRQPQLKKLQRDIHNGDIDTVVVWRLDVLAFLLRDGLTTICEWCDMSVRVVSVDQRIDLKGKAGPTLLSAILEMDRAARSDRTKTGVWVAQKNGRKGGRPPVTADHPRVVKFKELVEADELTSDEICESLEISKATYYRYLEL